MRRAQQKLASAGGARRAAVTSAPLLRRRQVSLRGDETSQEQAESLAAGALKILPEESLMEKLQLGRSLRIKLGLDPTAPDIHLGHTVVLQKLRQFQDAGHEVVLIIGDFTARVGDPTGRSRTRPTLDPAEIEADAESYAAQAFRVLDPAKTEIRRNSEWLKMHTIELFELARTTTVATILERDDFANRLRDGKPISLLELLYPVIQGYDSVAVRADVEIGGSDQTFNLLLARDIQRHYKMPEQACLTMPLLVGTDGVEKMSKSLGNSIGVSDDPGQVFGKAMSLPDEAMGVWYKTLYAEEPNAELAPVAQKRLLARSLAAEVGGDEAGARAEAEFDRIHVQHRAPDHAQMEEIELDNKEMVHLPALLARTFAISRGQARRELQAGSVRLDGEKLPADALEQSRASLQGSVLQLGKRRFARLA